MDEIVKPTPRRVRPPKVATPAAGQGRKTSHGKAPSPAPGARTGQRAQPPRRSAVEAWRATRAARKQARVERLAAQKAEQEKDGEGNAP